MDDVVEEVVGIAGRDLALLRPRDAEALLSEEAFEQEEFLPYWAELWPSALALARFVGGRALKGARCVELGCGLGLPSLAAALAGGRVLATDWSSAAIDLLAENAARNGATLDTLTLFSQTLKGKGTVTGKTVANSGATISPGASAGVLNTGDVTFNSGSNFNVELNGTTVGSQTVRPVDDLAQVVEEEDIVVGVLAVPNAAAQGLADRLVEAGVKIIFNYSEQLLQVPPEVTVHASSPAVDLLYALYFYLT